MPRPPVLFIPSMGTKKSTSVGIDLSGITIALGKRKKEKEREEALKALDALLSPPPPEVPEGLPPARAAIAPVAPTAEHNQMLNKLFGQSGPENMETSILPNLENAKLAKMLSIVGRLAPERTSQALLERLLPVPEKVQTESHMYQTEDGQYRWGLFDESGNIVKDLRMATDKEIKTKATETEAPANIREAKTLQKELGINFKEAYDMVKESKDVSKDRFMKDAYLRTLSYGSSEEAEQAAEQAGFAWERINRVSEKGSPENIESRGPLKTQATPREEAPSLESLAPQARGKIIRMGIDEATGRKVVQYEDGTIDYAD